MKRLTFNAHSRERILAGVKDMTHRWKPIPGIHAGDKCSAVSGLPKKPAFLTPAKDGFAYLEVLAVEHVRFDSITEDFACRSGFGSRAEAIAFYSKEKPDSKPGTFIYRYKFRNLGAVPSDDPRSPQSQAFHGHLDVCKQCRENPFGLCPVGARLLCST